MDEIILALSVDASSIAADMAAAKAAIDAGSKGIGATFANLTAATTVSAGLMYKGISEAANAMHKAMVGAFKPGDMLAALQQLNTGLNKLTLVMSALSISVSGMAANIQAPTTALHTLGAQATQTGEQVAAGAQHAAQATQHGVDTTVQSLGKMHQGVQEMAKLSTSAIHFDVSKFVNVDDLSKHLRDAFGNALGRAQHEVDADAVQMFSGMGAHLAKALLDGAGHGMSTVSMAMRAQAEQIKHPDESKRMNLQDPSNLRAINTLLTQKAKLDKDEQTRAKLVKDIRNEQLSLFQRECALKAVNKKVDDTTLTTEKILESLSVEELRDRQLKLTLHSKDLELLEAELTAQQKITAQATLAVKMAEELAALHVREQALRSAGVDLDDKLKFDADTIKSSNKSTLDYMKEQMRLRDDELSRIEKKREIERDTTLLMERQARVSKLEQAHGVRAGSVYAPKDDRVIAHGEVTDRPSLEAAQAKLALRRAELASATAALALDKACVNLNKQGAAAKKKSDDEAVAVEKEKLRLITQQYLLSEMAAKLAAKGRVVHAALTPDADIRGMDSDRLANEDRRQREIRANIAKAHGEQGASDRTSGKELSGAQARLRAYGLAEKSVQLQKEEVMLAQLGTGIQVKKLNTEAAILAMSDKEIVELKKTNAERSNAIKQATERLTVEEHRAVLAERLATLEKTTGQPRAAFAGVNIVGKPDAQIEVANKLELKRIDSALRADQKVADAKARSDKKEAEASERANKRLVDAKVAAVKTLEAEYRKYSNTIGSMDDAFMDAEIRRIHAMNMEEAKAYQDEVARRSHLRDLAKEQAEVYTESRKLVRTMQANHARDPEVAVVQARFVKAGDAGRQMGPAQLNTLKEELEYQKKIWSERAAAYRQLEALNKRAGALSSEQYAEALDRIHSLKGAQLDAFRAEMEAELRASAGDAQRLKVHANLIAAMEKEAALEARGVTFKNSIAELEARIATAEKNQLDSIQRAVTLRERGYATENLRVDLIERITALQNKVHRQVVDTNPSNPQAGMVKFDSHTQGLLQEAEGGAHKERLLQIKELVAQEETAQKEKIKLIEQLDSNYKKSQTTKVAMSAAEYETEKHFLLHLVSADQQYYKQYLDAQTAAIKKELELHNIAVARQKVVNAIGVAERQAMRTQRTSAPTPDIGSKHGGSYEELRETAKSSTSVHQLQSIHDAMAAETELNRMRAAMLKDWDSLVKASGKTREKIDSEIAINFTQEILHANALTLNDTKATLANHKRVHAAAVAEDVNEWKKLTTTIKDTNSKIQEISGTMSQFATSTFNGMMNMVGATTQFVENIRVMAEETGTTVVAGQELLGVFNQFGVSTSRAEQSVKMMSRLYSDAVEHGGGALKKWNDMGVSLQELTATGGDTSAVFELVTKKLAGMEDPMKRTAAAANLVGRSNVAAVSVLTASTAAINEAKQNTATLTEQQVKNLLSLGATYEQFQVKIKVFVASIVEAVAPTARTVIGMMSGLMSAFKDVWESVDTIVLLFATWAAGMIAVIGVIGVIVGTIGAFGAAITAVTSLLSTFVELIVGIPAIIAAVRVALAMLMATNPWLLAALALATAAAFAMGVGFNSSTSALNANTDAIKANAAAAHKYREEARKGLTMTKAEFDDEKEKSKKALSEADTNIEDAGRRKYEAARKIAFLKNTTLSWDNAAWDAAAAKVTSKDAQSVGGDEAYKFEEAQQDLGDAQKARRTAMDRLNALGAVKHEDPSDPLVSKKAYQTNVDNIRTGFKEKVGSGKGVSRSDVATARSSLEKEFNDAQLAHEEIGQERPRIQKIEGAMESSASNANKKLIEDDLLTRKRALDERLRNHEKVSQQEIDDVKKSLKEIIGDKYLAAGVEKGIAEKLETDLGAIRKRALEQDLEDSKKSLKAKASLALAAVATDGPDERSYADKAQKKKAVLEEELKEYRKHQTDLINASGLAEDEKASRIAKVGNDIIDLRRQFAKQEIVLEAETVDQIKNLRDQELKDAQIRMDTEIEMKKSTTLGKFHREEQDIAERLAKGAVSNGTAERELYELAQRRHDAEMAFATDAEEARKKGYKSQMAINEAAAADAKKSYTHFKGIRDTTTDEKTREDAQKQMEGAKNNYTKYERAGQEDKLKNLKAVDDYEDKMATEQYNKTKQHYAHLIEVQKGYANAKMELARLEKGWAEDAVTKAEETAESQIDSFQKSGEAALEKAQQIENAADREKAVAETTTRLVQDEAEMRTNLLKTMREAYQSEFGQIFDFMKEVGGLTTDMLESMRDSIEKDITALLSQHGAAAVTNKEFQGLLSTYKKVTEELEKSSKKKGEGLGLGMSWDAGSIHGKDGKEVSGTFGGGLPVAKGFEHLKSQLGSTVSGIGGEMKSMIQNFTGGNGLATHSEKLSGHFRNMATIVDSLNTKLSNTIGILSGQAVTKVPTRAEIAASPQNKDNPQPNAQAAAPDAPVVRYDWATDPNNPANRRATGASSTPTLPPGYRTDVRNLNNQTDKPPVSITNVYTAHLNAEMVTPGTGISRKTNELLQELANSGPWNPNRNQNLNTIGPYHG